MTEAIGRMTVGEKVERLRQFAQTQWEADNPEAADSAEETAAWLEENFGPDFALLSLHEALVWNRLTDEQKFVIRWQHRQNLDLGHFWTNFMNAIDYADGTNLQRIAQGFPEVLGVFQWRHDREFAAELRRQPFDFSI